MLSLSPCTLCPRLCGADRFKKTGFCGCTAQIRAARAALHFWEEPCISGTNGSGTIFFSGCSLQCCYCQNSDISRHRFGKEISVSRLSEIFLELQAQGAHNINLVTAVPYLPLIVSALDRAKPDLKIPVVYNTSGYERAETIRMLKDYVDIYLPDLKYFDPLLSLKYSNAENYFAFASAAVAEMISQTGKPVINCDGILQKGVIIRHLVLPGLRADSIKLLRWIAENLPADHYLLSLMSQFTPAGHDPHHPELNRRITTFEYQSVVNEALRLGLQNGYIQERSSARTIYTPPFDLTGI